MVTSSTREALPITAAVLCGAAGVVHLASVGTLLVDVTTPYRIQAVVIGLLTIGGATGGVAGVRWMTAVAAGACGTIAASLPSGVVSGLPHGKLLLDPLAAVVALIAIVLTVASGPHERSSWGVLTGLFAAAYAGASVASQWGASVPTTKYRVALIATGVIIGIVPPIAGITLRFGSAVGFGLGAAMLSGAYHTFQHSTRPLDKAIFFVLLAVVGIGLAGLASTILRRPSRPVWEATMGGSRPSAGEVPTASVRYSTQPGRYAPPAVVRVDGLAPQAVVQSPTINATERGGGMSGARWDADPAGRFQFRFWDGASWTAHVSTNGVPAIDPM